MLAAEERLISFFSPIRFLRKGFWLRRKDSQFLFLVFPICHTHFFIHVGLCFSLLAQAPRCGHDLVALHAALLRGGRRAPEPPVEYGDVARTDAEKLAEQPARTLAQVVSQVYKQLPSLREGGESIAQRTKIPRSRAASRHGGKSSTAHFAHMPHPILPYITTRILCSVGRWRLSSPVARGYARPQVTNHPPPLRDPSSKRPHL